MVQLVFPMGRVSRQMQNAGRRPRTSASGGRLAVRRSPALGCSAHPMASVTTRNGIRRRSRSMPAARSIPRPAPWSRRFIFRPPFNAAKTEISRPDSIIPAPIIQTAPRSKKRSPFSKAARSRRLSLRAWRPPCAVFQALAPNDHVVAPREAYHGVLRLLREVIRPLAARGRFRRYDGSGSRSRRPCARTRKSSGRRRLPIRP